MTQNDQSRFRLTVLNASGRDLEQHFPDGAGETAQPHPPTNFHAYAACTNGNFHRELRRAIAEATPVLLLLRGDFSTSERALTALQKEKRTVAIALKETGLHQIADQLRDPARLVRFLRIVNQADACIAPTPEAADFYRSIRGSSDHITFIPTPYPVDDRRWDFSRPTRQRRVRDDEKPKDAVTKAANATDEVIEVVAHIPALATWGMTEGEVRLILPGEPISG